MLTDYKRLSTIKNFTTNNNSNYNDPFNIGKTLASNIDELERENNDPNNVNKEPNLNHKKLIEKITKNLNEQNEIKLKCLEMIKDIKKELEIELQQEKQNKNEKER